MNFKLLMFDGGPHPKTTAVVYSSAIPRVGEFVIYKDNTYKVFRVAHRIDSKWYSAPNARGGSQP